MSALRAAIGNLLAAPGQVGADAREETDNCARLHKRPTLGALRIARESYETAALPLS